MKASHSPMNAGIISGIIAGIVFGAVMGMMGMLGMVAKLFGGGSDVGGFIIHIIFSAIIGGIFVHVFGKHVTNNAKGIIYGLVYGFIWWILGPLVIMPLWLGMGIQLFSAEGIAMAIPSLWGHLLYGFILGLVYDMIVRK